MLFWQRFLSLSLLYHIYSFLLWAALLNRIVTCNLLGLQCAVSRQLNLCDLGCCDWTVFEQQTSLCHLPHAPSLSHFFVSLALIDVRTTSEIWRRHELTMWICPYLAEEKLLPGALATVLAVGLHWPLVSTKEHCTMSVWQKVRLLYSCLSDTSYWRCKCPLKCNL